METIKKWAKQRIEEHSTWNGLGFILVGLIITKKLLQPL